MAERKKTAPGFEKSLTDLEKIITQMEAGDLPLDKTIALYEKGVTLVKKCEETLSTAKLKVEELKAGQINE